MYQRQKIKSVNQSLQKLSRILLTSRFQSPLPQTKTKPPPQQSHLQIQFIQTQLYYFAFPPHFLHNLYSIKCQQNNLKPNDHKYKIFIKSLLSKLKQSSILNTFDLNFKQKSLNYFISNIKNNQNIVGLELANIYPYGQIQLIINLLKCNSRLVKLSLRNLNMRSQQIKKLTQQILKTQNIISLDISNRNSQNTNKIGQEYSILQDFIYKNKTVCILELQGLNLYDKGLETIGRAFKNKFNYYILSLNLKNNYFSSNGYSLVNTIVQKSAIKQLNLSDNNLGNQYIVQFTYVRYSNLVKLNLSNTGLLSSGFIILLQKLKDNKNLQKLILDKNDFSQGYFQKIKQILPQNKCLKQFSIVDCKIKSLQSLFYGLIQNCFIQKINVSYNLFNSKYDQLCECLSKNQNLIQLKLRFCGIEQSAAFKLGKSLSQNLYLNSIDLSENIIGSQGGKQILKNVYMNYTLVEINLDKTQIDVSTRKFIEQKINNNLQQNMKKKRQKLNQQTKNAKQLDIRMEEQFEILKKTQKDRIEYINKLRLQIYDINIKFERAKKNYNETMRIFQNKLNEVNKQNIVMKGELNPIIKELQNEESELDRRIVEIRSQMQQNREIIKKLEIQVKIQKQNLKQEQKRLELQYRNKKYLNNKQNSLSLPKLQKKGLNVVQDKKSQIRIKRLLSNKKHEEKI